MLSKRDAECVGNWEHTTGRSIIFFHLRASPVGGVFGMTSQRFGGPADTGAGVMVLRNLEFICFLLRIPSEKFVSCN